MTTAQKVGQALSVDQLGEAIALALEAVRAKPQDMALRLLLIDVLILNGDHERADKQADMAAKLAPGDAVGLSILRGQIRGMDARAQWFAQGAVPSFPDGPSTTDEAAIRLNLALREGDDQSARSEYEAVEAAMISQTLSWNGTAAPDFRDADDRLPHALEVITTGGSYLWVDFGRIETLTLEPQRRPRDLAYRAGTLTLRSGSTAEILIPAIYGGPELSGGEPLPDAMKLGRQTDWMSLPGGLSAGQGQRCFLVGDEMEAFADAKVIEAVMEAELD